ncbi:MAG: UvrD-helicase domain-containing protein [Salibacteraceae bacterium]
MIDKKPFQVYKSSAGSGKTFALSRIFLQIVLSNADPSYYRKILAVTFTVKAAFEMKERIIGYLHDISMGKSTPMLQYLMDDTGLGESEIRQRSKVVLKSILHNYSDFSVLTIDKFFHRVVRSFASELDLEPDFEVEIDAETLVEEVCEKLIAKVGHDDAITHVLSQFVQSRLDDESGWQVKNDLIGITHFIESERFYPYLNQASQIDINKIDQIHTHLKNLIRERLYAINEVGKLALDAIESAGYTADDFHQKSRGLPGFFQSLAKINQPNDKINGISYARQTIEEGKWKSISDPTLIETLTRLYDDATEQLENLNEIVLLENIRKNIFTIGVIGELSVLLRQTKEDQNVRTLNDFYRLLADKFKDEQIPFIFEKLGIRYNHVLIDEFQDTSVLQWQNLEPILESSLSENNLSLIVGDAKQCLYRFRNSEPSLFNNLPRTGTPSQNLLEACIEVNVLKHNYRSARNIVNFNNRFFTELANSLLDAPEQSPYADLCQTPIRESEGKVRMTHMVKSGTESEFVAALISKLVEDVSNTIENEKINPGDVAVLVPTNDQAAMCASELLDRGYEVVSSQSLTLENSSTLKFVVTTLLACTQNTVFDAIRWLASAQKENLLNDDLHRLASETIRKNWDFFGLIKTIKPEFAPLRVRNSGAYNAVSYVCDSFRIDKEDPFIARLLDEAIQYDFSGRIHASSFATLVNEDRFLSQSIESQNSGAAIQVLTYHASKGLEFNHVFVLLPKFDSGRLTHSQYILEKPINEIELPVAIVNVKALKATPYHELYAYESNMSLLDSLNKLYVAFTRAKDTLNVYTRLDNKTLEPEFNIITNWEQYNAETGLLEIG